MTTTWIRPVYLYLFALIGLVLFTIGAVRLLDMGLRTFVFTYADAQERMRMMPPVPGIAMRPERIKQMAGDTTLATDERAALQEWVVEYNRWKEEYGKVDPVKARRQRDAASSLAMIIVGLPLFLFHWRLVRKERISEA